MRRYRRRRRSARHVRGRRLDSFTVVATDLVGNESSREVEYLVEASSGDDDGVSEAVEDAGPNGGDGNDDGTPDSEQDHVTSLPSWNGSYVTLAGPVGTNLVNVSAVDPETYGPPPSSYTLPDGLLSFTLEVPPGAEAMVRIYTPSVTTVAGYAKYHDSGWTLLPAANVAVGPTEEWIDITLVDGGIGDDDGVPNGSIVDPGGVAYVDSDGPIVNCANPPMTWSASNVSVACTASDAGSGLAAPTDAAFSLTTTVAAGSETANALTGSRQVCDVKDNCTTVGPIGGIKVDRKGPTVTITSPTGAPVNRGQSLIADYACTDGGSGLATCAGPVADNAAINTSVAGPASFAVTATDAVGNSTTRTVTYTVVAPTNVVPAVRADLGITGLNDVGFQGRSVAISGSFTDADGPGPYTASVRWTPTGSFVPMVVVGSQFVGSTRTHPPGAAS